MANYYVDIGVSEGAGAKDGSDIYNYKGWNQFYNHGLGRILLVSGGTYLIRGTRGTDQVSDGNVSATLTGWGSSPWRLRAAHINLYSCNVYWAVLESGTNLIVKSVVDCFIRMTHGAAVLNIYGSMDRCVFYLDTSISGNFLCKIFLSASRIINRCAFASSTRANVGTVTSYLTSLIFNKCVSNKASLQPGTSSVFYDTAPPAPVVSIPPSSIELGWVPPASPAYNEPLLGEFNLGLGTGTGPEWAWSPIADFTATFVSGVAGASVQFTDTSVGISTSWDWDFGDGTAHATDQNPEHVYLSPDAHTVSLTVSNSIATDIETKVGYIVITELTTLTIEDIFYLE